MTSEEALLHNEGRSSFQSSNGSTGERSDTTVWEGHHDYDGLSWGQKPSIHWLLPVLFMFSLAAGGIIVPRLNIILSLVCREYLGRDPPKPYQGPALFDSDNPACRIPQVQFLVAKFTLYTTLITGILSSIMSPKLGSLSDRYGRIKFLIITSLGGLLAEIFIVLAAKYPDTISYQWIYLGSALDGICGSFTTNMALTNAYATDCTPPSKRAVAFSYFQACFYSGVAIGPFFAAYVLNMTGTLTSVFFVALGIHIFFILFLLFIVPESLIKKRQLLARQRKFATGTYPISNFDFSSSRNFTTNTVAIIRSINPIAPLKSLWPKGPGTSTHLRMNLILLSSVDTIVFGIATSSMTVAIYYTGFQFGWGSADISIFMSIINSFRVFTLIALLPVFSYFFRTKRDDKVRRELGPGIPKQNSGSDPIDIFIIRLALIFEIVGYTIYSTTRTGSLFVFGGVLTSLGGAASPTLGAALTKHVPHERVGQLLGAMGLLHSVARIIAPTAFNYIYAETVNTYPQAALVSLTVCFGIAFLLSWFIRPNVYLERSLNLNL